MPATVYTSAVITLNAALKGYAPSNSVFNTEVATAALGVNAYANGMVSSSMSNADLSALVLGNMGLLPNADLNTALTQVFALNSTARGQVILNLASLLSGMHGDATYGAAADAWNAASQQAYAYSSAGTSSAVPVPFSASGVTFHQTLASAAGVDVMHLTGDQDVRIDFTDMLKQIRGLDLNGNGTIANDGKENNFPLGANSALANHPTDNKFEIVDAYARDHFNDFNKAANFLGDIAFDGTGFGGDGVATNGNIFLGGLGADTASGGNGNDFMAGGGIAQGHGGTDVMYGMRNADFFFAEFSGLDATDGSSLRIDGGITSDSNSAGTTQTAQDSDWLLFEASDDDEPVQIWLNNDNADTLDNRDGADGLTDGMGRVLSRTGESMQLDDIENVDASGNLYGFLKNLDVQLGGRAGDSRDPAYAAGSANNGQGSSAQLNISGSNVANKIIGGFDNDYIDGRDGGDLLMGGNLKSYLANGTTIAQQLLNPNLLTIVNDGRDELIGGGGADNIVFEADGGVIEGGATIDVDDADVDTLWLTSMSLGTSTAAVMATDGILRFDLGVGKVGGLDNFSGYGGADEDASSYTADQTNYAGAGRVQVQDMENVIATGLGAIDFAAAGSNTPELVFDNQQNFQRFTTSLDLRGTSGANTLYASNGTDVLEGRTGNDKLSGGEGDDDFVFFLQSATGDGVDVIHRQADANNDNLWDGYNSVTGTGGTFVQDFGQVSAAITANSKLTLTLVDTAHPADLTGFPVNGVAFKLDGVSYTVALTAGVQGTYDQFVAGLNSALDANPALTALDAVLNADKTITITDPAGKTFVSVGYTWVGNVTPPAGTLTWNQAVGGPAVTQTQDRLIYRSYEDRADGESVDDDVVTGSIISLGKDAYAQDLVISFQADGTRLAEDQSYVVTYTNLTTQDKVTTTVNGVNYTLQVGVDIDGYSIANEDTAAGTAQATIQANFLTRYTAFINSFMDNDTAAGQVAAVTDGVATITLTQAVYNGEETVFMVKPTVTLQNLSNGEPPSATVANTSQHEVLLFNYDARNLDGAGKNFDTNNVLFVGDSNVNQALLQTANNLTGGTITGTTADLVDGGVNDLAGYPQNTAPNGNPLIIGANFSVHGDDFLLGAAGADVINAGTGDDRVHGSRGADTMDGGKNYYAVKVLGEAEARVLTWNVWEAANPASAQSLLADPTLAGKVISSITLIDQTEDGINLKSGLFDDTLQYNQGDFNTGATRFTVTLDNYTVSGGVVSLNNGGAGHVTVDLTGDGATADDSTSAFSNFENVRTVSGTGLAVAGVGGGQGNDTLNVAALSTATGGIAYDLTNRLDAANPVGAGKVTYSADAHTSLTRPAEADFESLVMKVDGVESVIAGLGDDLLVIDETEAAKDNTFTADLGDDRIEYQNDFGLAAATEKVAQPTVTIKVNTAADQDKVEMTAGRVGTVVATDTLNSVEYITLAGNTATSARENDVLDVRAMTTGAVVSYVDGTVKDLAGVTQVTVEGIAQIENVWADGNDTVIVASSSAMGGANTREDFSDPSGATAPKDITFSTFLDFDEISGTTGKRVAFLNQTAAMITDTRNNGEYTFNLSKSGSGVDTDTVDYSMAANSISAVVELDLAQPNQYVLVDGDATYAFNTIQTPNHDRISVNDRIDVLVGVEKIVASQGESALDLTSSTKGLEIKFGAYSAANYQAAYDRDVYNVQISDLSSSVPLTRSYVEYREAGLIAAPVPATATAGNPPTVATATWNRIEGSDNAEKVVMNSAHSLDDDTFNLRGGANEVKYNELTRSITTTLMVQDYSATNPLGTAATGYVGPLYASTNTASVNQQLGTVMAITQFQDGNSVAQVGGKTHVVTSYTANNGITATGVVNSLRIAASQDAEDTLQIAGTTAKVFLLSEQGTTDNQITVKLGTGTAQNSVILTGYELLQDAASNDVYDMGALQQTLIGLRLIDSTADHDTIKVGNDAISFNTGIANTIDLNWISSDIDGADADANVGFNFDFDVLDITKVTLSNLVLVGGTNATPVNADLDTSDEVVLGALSQVNSITSFEAMVLTQASVTAGTSFTFNAAVNTLTQGSTVVSTTADVLSFGGMMNEGSLRAGTIADVTGNLTIAVAGGTAATVRGGAGNDTITGAGGNDVLYGNGGNDTLDGGTASEIRTIQVSGIMDAAVSGAITLTFGTAGSVVTLNELAIPLDVDPTDGTLDILAGSGSIAVATALQTLVNARIANINAVVDAFDTGVAGATDDAHLVGVTRADDLLTFTFTSGIDVQTADAIVAAEADAAPSFAISTDTTITNGGNGGADTFVFEKTAAANGADTINGFINGATGDTLNFSAFIGGASAFTGNTDFAAAGGANTLGAITGFVGYNKASLSAADIQLTAAAGKVALEDNGKAVIVITADVDGAVDATANPYLVYFVEDTDATGAQNYVVTLVGTLNSSTEQAGAGWNAANFA